MNVVPLVKSTMEIRSLRMSKTYHKNSTRLLIGGYANKRGLDLSKEVQWVSVGQRAAELPDFNLEVKINSTNQPGLSRLRLLRADR